MIVPLILGATVLEGLGLGVVETAAVFVGVVVVGAAVFAAAATGSTAAAALGGG